MINGKNLAEAGFRYLGGSYSQMDCQAFVEQCLRDCGLEKNLAGSNAWFREVMKNGAVMTPEECVRELGKVPAGAFLLHPATIITAKETIERSTTNAVTTICITS